MMQSHQMDKTLIRFLMGKSEETIHGDKGNI